jgi:hypothetical protein
VITIAEAREWIEPELLDHVLAQDHHHNDDDREPWWTEADWDEAVELAKIELAAEEEDCP